jgi:hypothetical protein
MLVTAMLNAALTESGTSAMTIPSWVPSIQ